MGMDLGRPELFTRKQEFWLFLSMCAVLIVVRLSFFYYAYEEFITKPFYYTEVKVLSAYEKTKNAKSYTVLKLRSKEGLDFYTTSHKKEDFSHTKLRVQIFPNEAISFKDYLSTFYVKSKIKSKEKLPETFKNVLVKQVSSQHKEEALASFYNAIFFATPLDKALREKISLLGVSHLVALSGFHLTVLWGLLYGLFLMMYKPLQQKYFPYRHALFDVGLLCMILLGFYVWFVGFPPSLLRSYGMVLFGWTALIVGVEVLSFKFLGTVLALLLVLFPSLLVSLSFWLSAAGVFYIFLLLQYTKKWNVWLITLCVIPLGIFMLMLPIVHETFGVTSPYQLASPLLSLAFIVFYPMMMLFHLMGLGAFFDTPLLLLFSLPQESKESLLPLWMVLGYVAVSLAAMWFKRMFYLTCALAGLYLFYLFLFIE